MIQAAHPQSAFTESAKGRNKAGTKCPCCGKRHGDGSPWWNKGKSGWSITVGRSSRLLAKAANVKDMAAHDLAIDRWHKGDIPGGKPEAQDVGIPTASGEETTVQEICDQYLIKLRRTASPNTIKNAVWILKDFIEHFGQVTVAQLRIEGEAGGVARIKDWATAHKTWDTGTLARAYKVVKAAFNHAAKGEKEDSLGLIQSSPIRRLNTGDNRAEVGIREEIFSEIQITAIMDAAESSNRSPEFATAFKMILGTGCRPEEFCSVTAADVHTDEFGRLYWKVNHKVQKKRKWAGKKRPVRLLKKELQQLTEAAMAENPDGPLFRNAWGKPWGKSALLNRFRAICETPKCKALGLNRYEQKKDKKKRYLFVPYSARHTFANRCLTGFYKTRKGQPIYMNYAQVADLMGNSAAEVERTYGKIARGTPTLIDTMAD